MLDQAIAPVEGFPFPRQSTVGESGGSGQRADKTRQEFVQKTKSAVRESIQTAESKAALHSTPLSDSELKKIRTKILTLQKIKGIEQI